MIHIVVGFTAGLVCGLFAMLMVAHYGFVIQIHGRTRNDLFFMWAFGFIHFTLGAIFQASNM